MLIVRGRDRRLAVPLSEVARLEELPASAVERAGHLEVIQYRDRLLPLVRLGESGSNRLTIVVHSATGSPLGLVVDSIVDVVEVDPELDRTTAAPGIRGSAVIGGHATDVLDVYGLAIASGVLTGAAA
jgi:two-component system chemotaxis sensor kinase CheA